MKGGRSRSFDMPGLKGKKPAQPEVVNKEGEAAGTPKAAEAEPLLR